MPHSQFLSLGFAVALLFAGCVAPESNRQECAGLDCTDQSQELLSAGPPPPRGDLQLPDRLYPVFQGRGCDQYLLNVQALHENVRPLVPDTFDFVSLSPGTTAVIMLRIFSLNETQLFGPAVYYQAVVHVSPINQSWTDSSLNFYVLDSASDNPDWSQALNGAFLAPEHGSATVAAQTLPGGGSLVLASLETDAWQLTAQYHHVGLEPTGYERQLALWYGHEEIHRSTLSFSFRSGGLPTPGLVATTGESNLAYALQSPAAIHALSDWYYGSDFLLQYDGAWRR